MLCSHPALICFSPPLSAATALVEGKVSKSLKKVLKALSDDNRQEELAVADLKLGISIKARGLYRLFS